ncbi:hypothetical protein [Sphingobium yanoikuyae]|uniref:hypothetical protein n=1 Tax=Sphingobium yanoikuyae TaxID=13690 RepID=UPI0035C6C21A
MSEDRKDEGYVLGANNQREVMRITADGRLIVHDASEAARVLKEEWKKIVPQPDDETPLSPSRPWTLIFGGHAERGGSINTSEDSLSFGSPEMRFTQAEPISKATVNTGGLLRESLRQATLRRRAYAIASREMAIILNSVDMENIPALRDALAGAIHRAIADERKAHAEDMAVLDKWLELRLEGLTAQPGVPILATAVMRCPHGEPLGTKCVDCDREHLEATA